MKDTDFYGKGRVDLYYEELEKQKIRFNPIEEQKKFVVLFVLVLAIPIAITYLMLILAAIL